MIELKPDLQQQLDDFLRSPYRNRWLATPQANVYVRKNRRVVGSGLYRVLDIGDVTIAEPLRGAGLFKQVFRLFKSRCGAEYQGILIENVLNPHLREYLCGLAACDPGHCTWNEKLQWFCWLKDGAASY
jgi:hypothetical protein